MSNPCCTACGKSIGCPGCGNTYLEKRRLSAYSRTWIYVCRTCNLEFRRTLHGPRPHLKTAHPTYLEWRRLYRMDASIALRHGLALTYRQIGELLGVSAQQAQQIVCVAERRWRHPKIRPLWNLVRSRSWLQSLEDCEREADESLARYRHG